MLRSFALATATWKLRAWGRRRSLWGMLRRPRSSGSHKTSPATSSLTPYQAYGLEKGALWQYAGPQMWWRGLTSVLRYGAARPVGDVKQMPGAFVIDQDGKILYAHRAVHSGDHESYDEILRLFQASRTSSPPTAAESQ
jgi:hypothetical protein